MKETTRLETILYLTIPIALFGAVMGQTAFAERYKAAHPSNYIGVPETPAAVQVASLRSPPAGMYEVKP